MQLLFTVQKNDTFRVPIKKCCIIEVIKKIVLLHYPTFQDSKDLNVFALISVPWQKAFTAVQT